MIPLRDEHDAWCTLTQAIGRMNGEGRLLLATASFCI